MSILCDLFVADPSDAPHYADDSGDHEWSSEIESVSLGGLTQLQFEILWAIVEGRPWQAEVHAFEWVGEPPEDGSTWLWRFPPPFVTVVATLLKLARSAEASKRGLFLWGSL